MVETSSAFYRGKLTDVAPSHEHKRMGRPPSRWIALFRQARRFILIGGLNTLLDLLVLNGLLWLFPTNNPGLIVLYTIFAYTVGATQSFLLNKYWTFEHRHPTTWAELLRFAATTLCGLSWNGAFVWFASNLTYPFITNTVLWTNIVKVAATASASLLSFLGLRLWVFVHRPAQDLSCSSKSIHDEMHTSEGRAHDRQIIPSGIRNTDEPGSDSVLQPPKPISSYSLSVILPAYNEERIIARTLQEVLLKLGEWKVDCEVIVVDDGSSDRTALIVKEIANVAPRVRLVSHTQNQGYGAALVSGFAAATKELTFFMDADGQFTIEDLRPFFPHIDSYDAVIGYRIARQDAWPRKLNAWGWRLLIKIFLGVSVRDIDCAFKLLHTAFLQQHPLETRGAMVNAELLHKLKCAGLTWKEIGVHHLPRRTGKATGARLSVILRAFRELWLYTRKCRHQK